MMMMMMKQQHYGRALRIQQKAGKSDSEKTKKKNRHIKESHLKNVFRKPEGWMSFNDSRYFFSLFTGFKFHFFKKYLIGLVN